MLARDMSAICPEHRKTCIVTVELNRYGAMTLRSTDGETYQVVATDTPTIFRTLDAKAAGSRVTVTLRRTPSRGDGWRVTAVETNQGGTATGTRRR